MRRPSCLRLLLGGLSLAALLLADQPAWAYEYSHCLGHARHWAANPTLEIDTCTVVGERLLATRGMIDAWNSIGGTDIRIRAEERGTCGARVGDRVNTLSFVPGHVIDGAAGVTLRIYGSRCEPYLPYPLASSQIVEADVFINGDTPLPVGEVPGRCPDDPADAWLPWLRQPCCDWHQGTVRATLLHELGHFLGLDHEDGANALMMSRRGEGRYCSARPWGLMPDDIAGVRRLYGRSGPHVREFSATGLRWVWPDRLHPVGVRMRDRVLGGAPPALRERLRAEPYPDEEELERAGCAGDVVPVQAGIANRGTLGGSYRLWWFASIDDVLSWQDPILSVSPWYGASRETMNVLRQTVTISPWLQPGQPYRLMYLIEPHWGWGAERRQGDNTGILPGTLTRRPHDACH